jgi:peptidylprolyl isomerase
MPCTPLPATVLLLASLALSCGAGPTGRQTTATNTRGEDPWLTGEGCTDAPADVAPRIDVLAPGSGEPVTPGVTVRVHYVASLANGTPLHDSHDGGEPSEITLGSTKTICGFERVLLGMRPGEQRRAVIPWSLAFGERGRPPEIPPETDVVVVVDLYLPANASIDRGAPPANPARGGRRR